MIEPSPNDLISKLGAAEKAALRILVDFPGTSLTDPVRNFFESHPWAGVILFVKNIDNASQVKALIQNLQTINQNFYKDYPLFVSVDEEGGKVSPLQKLVTPSPGNAVLGTAGDVDAAYKLFKRRAVDLRELGFNVNYAPVVDVNTNPKNPIIGVRAFGSDPQTVAKFGNAAIRASQEEGVMAVAKHFPGHGDTEKDSHLDLPTVHRTEQEFEKIDLYPFKEAVKAGAWGIMTAHVIYPVLDKNPATLSKKILTDILRKQLNFQGIIFTDSFAMAAIKEHFDLEEAVMRSVEAGADILLALGDASTQMDTFDILKKAIEKKKISEENINEPLRRILSFRHKLGLDFHSK